jgi:hypothetical protein
MHIHNQYVFLIIQIELVIYVGKQPWLYTFSSVHAYKNTPTKLHSILYSYSSNLSTFIFFLKRRITYNVGKTKYADLSGLLTLHDGSPFMSIQ